MRYAFPASILTHVAAVGFGYFFLSLPAAPDTVSIESVSVDLVSVSAFSSNQTSTIQSHATANLVSAGSKTLQPVEAEPLKPVDVAEAKTTPDTLQPTKVTEAPEPPKTLIEPKKILEPIKSAEVIKPKPVETKTIEPVAAEPIQDPIKTASLTQPMQVLAAVPISAEPIETIHQSTPQIMPEPQQEEKLEPIQPETAKLEPVKPLTSERLQPEVEKQANPVPVPVTRTVAQITKPTYPLKQKPKKTKKTSAAKKQPKKASAGNGGRSNADSRASSASSRASVSNYPGKVQSKLRRALRYPSAARGASGEARVQFIVAANGQASRIRVVKSSGNPAIDKAALATVKRANPFPKIPAGAGRSSWTFTIPLAFRR